MEDSPLYLSLANDTYAVKQNSCLFYYNSDCCLYMSATYLGLYLDHPQACQYKKKKKKKTLQRKAQHAFKGPVFTVAVFIMFKYMCIILCVLCFYILFVL